MSRWRIPRTGEVEVLVDAAPEEVYSVLTDVTRIAEWSHECRTAEWLDGATGATAGARFRGANEVGRFRWSRVCTITDHRPSRHFAYRTSGGLPPDSTGWSFELLPDGEGTRVVQRYEIVRLARWMELLIVTLVPAHRDRRDALRQDLVRLGTLSRAAR